MIKMEQANMEHAEDHGLHMTPEQEYSSSKLGMWLFLGTEIMLFGGLFAAYAIFRAKYPELFAESHEELNREMGAINTCILIFSSLTMAMGVTAIQRGKQMMAGLLILVTILCGLGFGVVKYFEYGAKFAHHIYPDTNIFFSLYFLMTGLHMLHVFIGLGILAVIAALTFKGKFNENYSTPVELGGLYWHLVDLIWIYLFPLLYLIH
jgi:cytochrome c oxidase subunit 3